MFNFKPVINGLQVTVINESTRYWGIFVLFVEETYEEIIFWDLICWPFKDLVYRVTFLYA